MNTKTKRTTETVNAVIIHNHPSEFSPRTKVRADRLVAAVRPITDEWYLRVKKAASSGCDAVVKAYEDYRRVYIATTERQPDEIFRYAALEMILNGILDDYRTGHIKVSDSTISLIYILRRDIQDAVYSEYPRRLFSDELSVFDLADQIDSLGLEYRN